MDSSSPPPPASDESDEYLTPQRSPSRLDFCLEVLQEGGDSPLDMMDWSCTSSPDDFPCTLVDTFEVDMAPLVPSRLLIMDLPVDDPPQATDSHAHEDTDVPPLFFASSDPEPVDEVAVEPQAPIPVRPPSVQMQAEAQEPQESLEPSRITPQRLNYPHRGFSRSALLQQKTLWNSRHEEWVAWQSRMDQGEVQHQEPNMDNAYTGLANSLLCIAPTPPSYMRIPPSGLERDLADQPPKRHEQDVHASIFPRVGDISALRDPYAVNIDRSFYKLPLWTLNKTLYAFSMQQRSASPTPLAPAFDVGLVQASISSSTLSSYSSSTAGEDEESDSTLVVEDSPVPRNQPPPESLKRVLSPQGLPSCSDIPGWEPSWYARWEVLIGIFQGDHTGYSVFGYPVELAQPSESRESQTAASAPPRRSFRFTIGDGEDEYDEDDDEDYGTPIANSTFSVDEECERALAFYDRALKSLKVTW